MKAAVLLFLSLCLVLRSQESATRPGDFGAGQPVERTDLPERGQIVIPGQLWKFASRMHWHEYGATATCTRPGTYRVRARYSSPSPVRAQFRLGEQRLRVPLPESLEPRDFTLGVIKIDHAGEFPVVLLTPRLDHSEAPAIQEMRLIPDSGQPPVIQGEDGAISLPASAAFTWSENMRYEEKPQKNCLGFWTDPKDWAEWTFEVLKPGVFNVNVTQGCRSGGGSDVVVESNHQKLNYKVVPTGGFQNWKAVDAGKIEFKKPGVYQLSLKPQNKLGAAVTDIQKIALTPAS